MSNVNGKGAKGAARLKNARLKGAKGARLKGAKGARGRG